MQVLKIQELIAADLFLRESVDRFFDNIERIPDSQITIDFSSVRSISRSFAHQYHLRKEHSVKEIFEQSVPENVRKMFEIIQQHDGPVRLVQFDRSNLRFLTA